MILYMGGPHYLLLRVEHEESERNPVYGKSKPRLSTIFPDENWETKIE